MIYNLQLSLAKRLTPHQAPSLQTVDSVKAMTAVNEDPRNIGVEALKAPDSKAARSATFAKKMTAGQQRTQRRSEKRHTRSTKIDSSLETVDITIANNLTGKSDNT